MDNPIIDLRNVAKTYGRSVHALRGVQMQVAAGEIFGLLGPNGAGKSTLVKIMMTVVRPTRAEGTLLGRPLGHKPTLARVGYLPEHPRLPPYLTGRQAMEFFAALSGVERRTRRRRAAELLEAVRMQPWGDVPLRTYSKGMQQRIALAQALMNDPQLLVLDEPTDGLDPVARKETRDLLLDLRARGKTVFLNSHLLGEVEQICDRVAILAAGNVVRQGKIDDLTAYSMCYVIELSAGDSSGQGSGVGGQGAGVRGQGSIVSDQSLTTDHRPPTTVQHHATQAAIRAALPCPLAAVLEPAAAGGAELRESGVEAGQLPSGEKVELTGTTLRIACAHARQIQPILDALRGRGLVIEAVRPMRQSLEDYFVQTITAGSATGGVSPPGGVR